MRGIGPFLTILLCGLSIGCGGTGNTNPPGQVVLSPGNWQLTTLSSISIGQRFSIAGNLAQSGNAVFGIMHIVFPPCFFLITDIPVSGTVNGPTLTLTTQPVNGQVITLTLSGSSTSLSGSYSLSAGTCGAPDQGTVNAALVPPITGTWRGTFTSATGTATQVSATLTQTGPDAHGFFSATGSATFTGRTCFAAGTVLSGGALINGVVSVVTVATNDPGVVGSTLFSVVYTDPSTATALSGTYTSHESTCADNGTVTLNKQ